MATQPRTKGSLALLTEGKFTLEDWRTWPDDERCELIHGEAYNMSPAPRMRHQRLVGSIYIVEVLSDSTSTKDLGTKRNLYESAGVREYWIINPVDGGVFVYILEGGCFARVKEFRQGEMATSTILDGFSWAWT